MVSLLYFNVFVVIARAACVSSFSTNSVMLPPPLLSYALRSKDCNQGTFVNDGILLGSLPFVRNTTTTSCSSGMGVEVMDSEFDRISSLSKNFNPNFHLRAVFSFESNQFQQQQQNHLILKNIDTSQSSNNDARESRINIDGGITFSFWLRIVPETLKETGIIFNLGGFRSSKNQFTSNTCDRENVNLQLIQNNDSFEMKYNILTNNNGVQKSQCQRVKLFDLKSKNIKDKASLMHISIVLKDKYQQVYMNGEPSSQILRHDLDISSYYLGKQRQSQQDDYGMNFFSSPTSMQKNAWHGHILQFTMYDIGLDQDQVEDSFNSGLKSSLPFAYPFTITINEDSEIKQQGSFLAQSSSSIQGIGNIDNLQTIPLPIGSIDREFSSLLVSLSNESTANITNDTMFESTSLYLTPYIYITRLPSVGNLYHDDGTLIVSNFTAVRRPFNVIYIPVLNEHSESESDVYVTFNYCVSEHPLFDPRQCKPAIISIVVKAINDLPITKIFNPSTSIINTSEGKESPATRKIKIGGIDIDDSISKIQITEPPEFGHLILSVTSFRLDELTHGMLLSDTGYEIPIMNAKEPYIEVKYIYDGSNDFIVQGQDESISVRDHFTFRVADQFNEWSTDQAVQLNVISAVDAFLPSNNDSSFDDSLIVGNGVELVQDSIHLYGKDYSGYKRKIGYYIESIPDAHVNGVFVDGNTNEVLHAGTQLYNTEEYPYEKGATIIFRPSDSFCDSNNKSTDYQSQRTSNTMSDITTNSSISFSYRILALSDNVVVSTSSVIFRTIQVKCKSGPMEISYAPSDKNDNRLFTKQFHLSELANSGSIYEEQIDKASFGGNMDENRKFESKDFVVVLNNIRLISADQHLGAMARVHVFATTGAYITFNLNHWDKVKRLILGRRVLSSDIIFEAMIEDFHLIFKDLTYQSAVIGNNSVNIVLQHGHGCASFVTAGIENITEKKNHTDACNTIQSSIPIDITEDSGAYTNAEDYNWSFPWQIIVCWCGYPLVFLIIFQIEYLYSNISLKNKNEDERDRSKPDKVIFVKWRQRYDQSNNAFFYENLEDGAITWMVPSEAFLPCENKEEIDCKSSTLVVCV